MYPWPWPMNNVTTRPEVGTPRRSAGRAIACLRAGAAFGTAPRLRSSTLPARFRTSTLGEAAATEPAAALGLRPCFVDGQAAAADLARVQLGDGVLCFFVRAHLDKRKPAGAPRRLVAHHGDRFDRSGTGEQLLELVFADFVGQISDVQLPTHKH